MAIDAREATGNIGEKQSKYYFASDFHLGVPNAEESRTRELRIIAWLDMVRVDATEIFILGDVFDFWFEYKHVVPRGYTRLLGKIAEIADSGIPIHWFTGNHDMWIFDYIPKELGVTMHHAPIERELNGYKCYIGHGDGLGPGDYGYKFIKKVFRSPILQWLFARIHPNTGIGIANYFSGRSRGKSYEADRKFLGKEGEWLAIYAEEISNTHHYDYFIFGHRHLPIAIKLNDGGIYYNLGEWLNYDTFGTLDLNGFRLEGFGTNPIVHSNM